MTQQPVRVGVVGTSRGVAFADVARAGIGLELVAICDTYEERLRAVGNRLGVATYTDYDDFLASDLDAVVLANYFHQHAPLAIRALDAGRHVFSETTAVKTLAEGVELVEAVERSGLVYMLGENYPDMVFNQEMRRLYHAGEVGRLQYAEGEYVHTFSAEFHNRLSPGADHWRNWIPSTYYCTHSIAPIMRITDTMPRRVSGFIIPRDDEDENASLMVRRSDTASVIMVELDNGAYAKLLQYDLHGELSEFSYVRIHGTRGAMENARHGDSRRVIVRKAPFLTADHEPEERVYLPSFEPGGPDPSTAGHGGSDLFPLQELARAIRTGEPPYFDVHRGVAMSAIGIQAYRSAHEGSRLLDIPDLRDPAQRDAYRDDRWSPDPADRADGQPWPSIQGDVRPGEAAEAHARAIWEADALAYGTGD